MSDLAESKCVFLAIKLNTTSQGFLLQLAPPALADVKLNATSVLAQNFGWPLDTGLEIMDEDHRILARSGLDVTHWKAQPAASRQAGATHKEFAKQITLATGDWRWRQQDTGPQFLKPSLTVHLSRAAESVARQPDGSIVGDTLKELATRYWPCISKYQLYCTTAY